MDRRQFDKLSNSRRHSVTRFALIAALTALSLIGASTARAQTATFSDITDAVPGRFFDAATTTLDEFDPNTLVIGLNSGFDYQTLKFTDFRASTTPLSHMSAMDTISFTVEAPERHYIASITYAQRGRGNVVRTGRAAGTANWVVGDLAADLGVFGTNPELLETMDLRGFDMTRISVSISNSLFAFSTPVLGSATVAVTLAAVHVELLPFPEPPEPEPSDPEPSEPEPSPEQPSASTSEPLPEPPAAAAPTPEPPPVAAPEPPAPPPVPTPEQPAPPPSPSPEPVLTPDPPAPPLDPAPVP
jgi:hypothetical protein